MGETNAKGLLKLAILFVLSRGSLHGYEMMKNINEWTLGTIKPTAGRIYPSLRELEKAELITGEWKIEQRRKVYTITQKGQDVFQKAVEKHFELVSSLKNWVVIVLRDLQILEEDVLVSPTTLELPFKLLLLKHKASQEEKIHALETIKKRLQENILLFNKMISNIDNMFEKLQYV